MLNLLLVVIFVNIKLTKKNLFFNNQRLYYKENNFLNFRTDSNIENVRITEYECTVAYQDNLHHRNCRLM